MREIKSILVTGGCGFIGSNFIKYLLEFYPKLKIVNLDLLTYAGSLKNVESVLDKHIFIKGDIRDSKLVSEILRKYEIDTIVNFAAETHVDNSIENPEPFIETNIVGTYSLLKASKEVWDNREDIRFHHVSTDEIFGSLSKDDPPRKEVDPIRPNSPYSASKAAADFLVRSFHKTFNLPVSISMCCNNFGPFQHDEKLIPTVIKCCFEKKPIPVYGDGSNIREWIYVLDHCYAIDLIIRKGRVGESYNIGSGFEIDNLALVTKICDILTGVVGYDCSKLITFVEDRPGHDFRYSLDSSKIKKELSWKCGGTLSFLTDTIFWYASRFRMERRF